MKVNKFSRMYLVGMICILLSGFFPYFRYRFTIQDVETLKQGYPLLNLKKLATLFYACCAIFYFTCGNCRNCIDIDLFCRRP